MTHTVKSSEQLIAYIATLIALLLVMFMAFAFGAYSQRVMDKMEVFALGTAVGGLIGLLRGPSATQGTALNGPGKANANE